MSYFRLSIIVALYLNTHSWLRSQNTWITVNSGVSVVLSDIHFVNELVGYTVGADGTILKSTDGGFSWSPQNSGTTADLYDVEFFTENIGYACGNGGIVLRTTDGGNTWLQKIILTNDDFKCISVFSATAGYVAGKNTSSGQPEIYYTTDGGVTFNGITPPSGFTDIIDIKFSSVTSGVALDYYAMAYTTSTGLSWPALTIPTTYSLYKFDMASATTGWVIGDFGAIYKTTTTGAAWSTQVSPSTNTLRNIDASDELNVYACGNGGLILHTIDGGDTWLTDVSPTTSLLHGIYTLNSSNAWACGDQGTIIRTSVDTDLELQQYTGPTSACIGSTVEVTIQVKNGGSNPITSGTFSVLNGITEVISLDFTGYIAPGSVESLSLGTFLFEGTSILTINYTGDAVNANNSLVSPVAETTGAAHGIEHPNLSACVGDVISFTAFGGESYFWLNIPGDSLNPTQEVLVTGDAEYYVEIKQGTCIYTDTVFLSMSTGCNSNAFSPNSDGVNDYFHIDNLPSGSNTVIIYNRWGDELMTLQNYDNSNVFWDGSNPETGSTVEGVFYYIVQSSDFGNWSSGWVKIVR